MFKRLLSTPVAALLLLIACCAAVYGAIGAASRPAVRPPTPADALMARAQALLKAGDLQKAARRVAGFGGPLRQDEADMLAYDRTGALLARPVDLALVPGEDGRSDEAFVRQLRDDAERKPAFRKPVGKHATKAGAKAASKAASKLRSKEKPRR